MNVRCNKYHWNIISRKNSPKANPYSTQYDNEVHEGNQEQNLLQVEIQAQRPRLPIKVWGKLHQNLLTCSNVISIQILLIILVINRWHTCQVDFMLTYLQTTIYHDLYMNILKRKYKKTENGKTHLLNLIKNLYIKKQAGIVWND